MTNKLLIFVFFLTIHPIFAINYNKTDSIKTVINKETNDSIKIINLLQLGDIYEHSIPDTALYFYSIALNKSKKINNANLIGRCLNYIGIVYTSLSEYEKAIIFFQKSMEINKKLNNKIGIANCYNNIGRIRKDQGEYEQAIKNYTTSINIYEKIDYKIGMAYTYGNIGNIHTEQKNRNRAVEYYKKALALFTDLDNKRGMSYCYNNLGLTHKNQSNFDKSIEYYKKSLEIKETTEDQEGIATTLSNIGYVYQLKGDFEKAFDFYHKSLEIDIKLDSKKDIAIDYTDIASLQILISDSTVNNYEKQRYINNAIENAHKSLKIATEINSMPEENTVASILMNAYERKGNYKKSIKYYKLYISTKDSLFSSEKIKVLAEMENMFEVEKNRLKFEKLENQKKLDEKVIEAQKAENNKQTTINISIILGLIFVSVFLIIVLRMLRLKRIANYKLLKITQDIIEKNNELNHQSEELHTLNDNLTNQNVRITIQKNEIERIHHQLSESIDYATRLQETILPTKKILKTYLPEHFLLFKPKDKVSGDFYWWTNINNHTIIAVADCTGHGVPGAFMSMLGISFLEEIINKENTLNPSKILNTLRTKIIKTLKQKNDNSLNIKDGIDMAIISINHETNTLQYSGANNSIYLITKRNLQKPEYLDGLIKKNNNLLYEIKPNKMPIGIYHRMDKFTTQEMHIEKGDQIYLFSDGYADQFGGEEGKKYKYKKFKQLLLNMPENISIEQKQKIIDDTFEQWKKGYEQLDDIIVVGIKF